MQLTLEAHSQRQFNAYLIDCRGVSTVQNLKEQIVVRVIEFG